MKKLLKTHTHTFIVFLFIALLAPAVLSNGNETNASINASANVSATLNETIPINITNSEELLDETQILDGNASANESQEEVLATQESLPEEAPISAPAIEELTEELPLHAREPNQYADVQNPYCSSRSCAANVLASSVVARGAFGHREILQIEQDPLYPCSLEPDGSILCEALDTHKQQTMLSRHGTLAVPVTDYRKPVYESYTREAGSDFVRGVRVASFEEDTIDATRQQRIAIDVSQTGAFVVGFASNVFIVTDFTYGTCENCSMSASQVTLENEHATDSSRVLSWRFSGDGTDSSGQGNNATFNGGTFVNNTFADGFGSASTKLSAPDANSLDLVNMTLSFWVRFDSVADDQTLAFRYTGTNGFLCVLTDPANVGIQCYTRNSTGVTWVKTGGPSSNQDPDIQTNTWYHVALTYDKNAGNLSIYLDGTLKQSTIATNQNMSSTAQFKFGNDYFDPFQGDVDEINLFSRALNGAEISSLYADGLYITSPSYGNYTSLIDLGAATELSTVTWSSSGNVTLTARTGEYAKPSLSDSGLVGYWPLNQSLLCADATGNYDGSASSVTCGDVTGPFSLENGTLFDSDSDKITLPLTTGMPSSWTVQVWARSDGTCTEGQNIFVKAWDYRIYTRSDCGINMISGNSSGTSKPMYNVCSLADERWHLLSYVHDEAAQRSYAYCDGVLRANITQEGTRTTSTNFTIGGGSSGLTFRGSIAHVSLWNRSLSAAELVTWTPWSGQLTSGSDPGLASGRYVQYSAVLSTDDTRETPVLSGVAFGADTCSLSQGYNATLMNGAAVTSEAVSLDGTDDYVDTDLNVASALNNGSFTLSLWVDSDTDLGQRYFWGADSGGSNRFYLRQTDTANQIVIGVGSWNTVYTSSGALSGWTHYVVVINGTSGTLYRNNAVKGTASSITKEYPSKSLVFGKNPDSSANYFDGNLDGIAMYDRALSASEVGELYSNTSITNDRIFAMDFTTCSTEYTYDANGNLESDGTYYYEYNDFNKLVRVRNGSSGGAIVTEYAYDNEGIRFLKKEYSGGVLTSTTYYPESDFVRENASGTISDSVYYRAGDTLVAEETNGNRSYILTNHLGSTYATVSAAGTLIEKTVLDPYGNTVSGANNRYVYTGHERDNEIGLDYMKARYYSPEMATFAQPDSLLPEVYDPQQLNRYAYVKNNPVKNIDPDGRTIAGYQAAAEGAWGPGAGYSQGQIWQLNIDGTYNRYAFTTTTFGGGVGVSGSVEGIFGPSTEAEDFGGEGYSGQGGFTGPQGYGPAVTGSVNVPAGSRGRVRFGKSYITIGGGYVLGVGGVQLYGGQTSTKLQLISSGYWNPFAQPPLREQADASTKASVSFDRRIRGSKPKQKSLTKTFEASNGQSVTLRASTGFIKKYYQSTENR